MNRSFVSKAAVAAALLAMSPAALAQTNQPNQEQAGQDQAVTSHLGTLLSAWQAQNGPNWHVRANAKTGTLEMLYGGSASMGEGSQPETDEDWYRLSRHWLAQSYAMHGVNSQDLVEDKVRFLPLGQSNTNDKMTVSLRQEVSGVPVEDGRVNALYNMQGTLLSLHTTAAPSFADRSIEPKYSAKNAVTAAQRAFFEAEGIDAIDVHEAQLIFAHVDDGETRRWTLAWQVDVQNTEVSTPVGYLYTLDAHTGAVLKRASSVHFFDVGGTISTMATPGTQADHAGNTPVSRPVPYARVTSSAGTTFTDENGNFNYPGVNTPLDLSVQYFGTYTNSNHDQGSDYSITFNNVPTGTNNNLLMNASPTEYVTAEANAYLSIAEVRDWIVSRVPTDTTADFQGPANCNIDDSCNAFFNGNSTNYFNRAGSCNNTAFSAVVAHEFGHWLNVLYGTGNGSDGIGEGNADVFALYLYDTPIMGSFFFTSGGAVRNANNNRQYCGDGNGGCYGQVHTDGEVWMATAWNVRENLDASMGNAAGDLHADLLFLGWMNAYNQTTIDSIIETQWLTLDDDDGNINNGTPNFMDIDSGFEEQGFPGYDLPFITFANQVAIDDTRDEDGPYLTGIDMSASFNPPVASGSLLYKVNNGPWNTVAMTNVGGDTFAGSLPGITSPATVQYYYRGEDSSGGQNEFPAAGASSPFEFRVGTLTEFLFTEFEAAGDEGWTGGVAGDTATTGIWERGNPVGTEAQTEDDHTEGGNQCWFTGQGNVGGGLGANDVDGGATTLLSPVFDAAGLTNAEISYWRWYSNNTGASPNNDTFLVQLSGDGGNSWSTVETVGPNGPQTNGGWFQHSFEISNIMTPTANMRLRFEASDNGAGSIVEAAIDDIRGFSLDPSNTLLGTNYCNPANSNSTGFPGTIAASGSNVAATNEVTLSVSLLPANEFGFFLNGTQMSAPITPIGSSGNLCLGGEIGRYNRVGEIFNSGAFGSAELVLDLTDTQTSTQPTSIQAGETWQFQCWYRDTVASSSNFTDAVSITFQ